MSTMHFPGWGTVHMWDASQTAGKKNKTKRRVNIETRVDDEENTILDWFSGRLSTSSVHEATAAVDD